MTPGPDENRKPSNDFQSNSKIRRSLDTRERGTAIFGVPRPGKSTCIKPILHQEASTSRTITVIDPHTDNIQEYL